MALYSSKAFTLSVNDLLVGYQTSDEVFVTVIEDDTLAFFGAEADTLYNYITRGYCGYISGNNCDLDKIKANYFSDEMISYDVEKVLLRFGKAVKTTADEVPVKFGIWSKSSTSDTPGDLIDYQEVKWTHTAANEWLSYSSDTRFFLRVSNAIFPVVKQNNVGINDFVQMPGN